MPSAGPPRERPSGRRVLSEGTACLIRSGDRAHRAPGGIGCYASIASSAGAAAASHSAHGSLSDEESRRSASQPDFRSATVAPP
jgi:hypothetical protein